MTAQKDDKPKKITDSLHELEEIVDWFESQNQVEVDEGLDKVKKGVELIKQLKTRIQKVENEFEEIKKELIEEIEES